MKIKLITLTALITLSTVAAANQWYFKKLDVDQNGSINVEEFKQHSKAWMDIKGIKDQSKRAQLSRGGFNKMDTNKDNKITFEEFETFKSNKK